MRVKDRMIDSPVSATVPGSRRELVDLFLRHGYGGFPVVKEGSRKLAGVVTRLDLFDNPEEPQTALVMNPNPATTYAEAPLPEAAQLVARRRLRILPVVNGANDLVGIITPGELLEVAGSHRGLVAGLPRQSFVPVHQGTPCPVAFEIIRATRARALPVLDDDARLCGIVTDGDLLKAASVDEKVHRTAAGQRGDGDKWEWEKGARERRLRTVETRLRAPPQPVSHVMVQKVLTIAPNTPVREAAATMADRRLNQLPILGEDGRLLGVLTDHDVLAAAV